MSTLDDLAQRLYAADDAVKAAASVTADHGCITSIGAQCCAECRSREVDAVMWRVNVEKAIVGAVRAARPR